MKATGIVRKVDELGRIVLPVEMRRTLDIAEKDALEIYVEGTSVILKKYKPSCIFCDATKNVTMFKNKCVCPKCLVSHREKRSERDSRIVELRITTGVGNSSAAEAVSRSARGGCSKRPTEGTMRLIFRTVFRSAV